MKSLIEYERKVEFRKKNQWEVESEDFMFQVHLGTVFYREGVEGLKCEIERRKKNRKKILKGIRAFGKACYGIPNLDKLIEAYFNTTDNRVNLLLARAMSLPVIEQLTGCLLANYLCEKGLDCNYGTFTMLSDTYGDNPHKRAWAKKIETVQKNGHKKFYEIETALGGVAGRCFGDMEFQEKVDFGNELGIAKSREGLQDFYDRLWHCALGNRIENFIFGYDAGSFLEKCLYAVCVNDRRFLPEYLYEKIYGVYVKSEAGEAIRRNFSVCDLRPPAYWYYPLSMALYATGERILLAYRDKTGDRFEGYFAHSAEMIERYCGVAPLIIEMPSEICFDDIKVSGQEIPLQVLQDPNWIEKMSPAPFKSLTDIARNYMERLFLGR